MRRKRTLRKDENTTTEEQELKFDESPSERKDNERDTST